MEFNYGELKTIARTVSQIKVDITRGFLQLDFLYEGNSA